MSFPRYPKYKHSGVQWLGEIPDHWKALPIRFVARLESGHTPSRSVPEYWENCDVPWFTLSDIWQIRENQSRYIVETEEKISEAGLANSAARLLPAKTVMLSRTASVGFSAIMGVPMATTQDFANWVCGPRLQPEFLLWTLQSMEGEFARLKMGSTHNTIYMPDIQSLRFALPPIAEQGQIVAFLDRETAKIDALVAEQRRLIELLNEKCQTVVIQSVTKGLNPHARMKNSGIEWVGDVPAHWDVVRLGNVYRETSEAGRDDLPILSVSIHHGVSDAEVAEEESERKVIRMEDRSKYVRVAKDDLVYNMMRAWQGAFGAVEVDGMVSPAYVVARPRRPIVTAFVEKLLRTPQAIEQMRRYSQGVTDFRLRLYWDEFKNIRVALPPNDEARAICAHIAAMQETFERMTQESERLISLLIERRTALVSAAVAGRIDVRHLGARADTVIRPGSSPIRVANE